MLVLLPGITLTAAATSRIYTMASFIEVSVAVSSTYLHSISQSDQFMDYSRYYDIGIASLLNVCDVDGVCTKRGVQCLSYFGFGLSGGVQGSISDIDSIPTMFW